MPVSTFTSQQITCSLVRFNPASSVYASCLIFLCKYDDLYVHVHTGGKKAKFGPNLNEFVRRFDSVTTDGQGVSLIA